MKYLSLLSLIVSILLAVTCYQLWQQSQQLATQMQSIQSHNEELLAELKANQDEMSFMREKLLEFEKHSLKGVADQANDAFLEGWESLIGIVGKEIDQARKNLEQQRRKQSEPATPPADQGSKNDSSATET
ncbi:hypothetical protein [uncultured Pseudoteredinibacter sp.]|uniref:hypothetical protein n=1 Tax=uncultured Pseudoteredinibacter sp. TaxID=1641701 RepID=UPI00261A7679|nr:hypothetical protein [uncultured Pseudoteredinibacter sp.]